MAPQEPVTNICKKSRQNGMHIAVGTLRVIPMCRTMFFIRHWEPILDIGYSCQTQVALSYELVTKLAENAVCCAMLI